MCVCVYILCVLYFHVLVFFVQTRFDGGDEIIVIDGKSVGNLKLNQVL